MPVWPADLFNLLQVARRHIYFAETIKLTAIRMIVGSDKVLILYLSDYEALVACVALEVHHFAGFTGLPRERISK